LEVTPTDIRLLKQDEYLLLMEIVPDDEIMQGMFLSIAKSIKDGFDGISYTYAAFADDLIIGFIYGFVLPNKALLPQYLYVDPQYRKQGIGRQLLETLESKSGCTTSIAYFEKSLSNYYAKQGYIIGDAVVALKELKNDK
jgi:GNAT superfamily N-acetyltransferase